jgi:hypothetical protein
MPVVIQPDEEVSLQLSFWKTPYVANPIFNFPSENLEMSTFGNPGMECGPYPIPVIPTCNLTVSIASENSSNPYDVFGDPSVGTRYYTDRTHTITYLPQQVDYSVLLRTPNADRNQGNSLSLKVNVNKPVYVWIAYAPNGTPPNWIRNNYTNTGLSIGVSDTATSTMKLWRRASNAGQITFSGNKAAGWGGTVNTNYIIFFTCQ